MFTGLRLEGEYLLILQESTHRADGRAEPGKYWPEFLIETFDLAVVLDQLRDVAHK